jgi:hypothetical protein
MGSMAASQTRPVPIAFRVQRFLRGLRYPASKSDAIEHAMRRGAGEDVLGALRALAEGVYESPTSLAASMAADRS